MGSELTPRQQGPSRATAERGARNGGPVHPASRWVPVVASPATGGMPLRRAALLQLQRLGGNRAVVSALDAAVQRDGSGVRGTVAVPDVRCESGSSDPACSLDGEQRTWLRGEVGDRINAAFTAYMAACEDEKGKLRAAMQANAAMLDLLLSVAFGWGVSALTGLVNAGINKIPVGAPDWIQRAGLRILEKPELVKTPLNTLGQAIRSGVKSRYPKNGIEFLDHLQDEAQDWAQAARGEIPGYADDDLLTAYAVWDASNTHKSLYLQALGVLMRQFDLAMLGGTFEGLMPPSMTGGQRWSNRAVWVQVYPGAPPALAMMLVYEDRVDDPKYGSDRKEYFLRDWVTKEVQQIAIDRTKSRFATIDVIGPNDYRTDLPGMGRRPNVDMPSSARALLH